jgi:hypothetical protein
MLPKSARPWALVAGVALVAAGAGAALLGQGNDMPQGAVALATLQGVRIDEPVVAVRLPVPSSGRPAERLRQDLAAPGRDRIELVLEDVAVAKPPRVLFNVYLSTLGPAPRRQYVGTLSFFGIGPRPQHGTIPRRTFEVTRELRALQGGAAALPDLQVVFEATEGTADSTPEKAGPLFDRESGLRIGSLQLRLQGDP